MKNFPKNKLLICLILLALASTLANHLMRDRGGRADPYAFEITKENGDIVPLSKLANQRFVLHFWATWCAPCLEELPKLNRFIEQHPELGREVITISLDGYTKIDKVKEFLDERQLEKIHSYTAKFSKAQSAFSIRSLPTTIIFEQGQEVKRIESPVNWDDYQP